MYKQALLFILFFSLLQSVQGASLDLFADCQRQGSDGVMVELGYTASDDAMGVSRVELVGGADVQGIPPGSFLAGTHHRVFAVWLSESGEATWTVEGVDVYASLTILPDAQRPACQENHSGQPDGGIVTITALVDGIAGEDVCTWEIHNHGDPDAWDAIDGATGVEIDPETGATFCRLPLGGDNLDHDPAHYRATVRTAP